MSVKIFEANLSRNKNVPHLVRLTLTNLTSLEQFVDSDRVEESFLQGDPFEFCPAVPTRKVEKLPSRGLAIRVGPGETEVFDFRLDQLYDGLSDINRPYKVRFFEVFEDLFSDNKEDDLNTVQTGWIEITP